MRMLPGSSTIEFVISLPLAAAGHYSIDDSSDRQLNTMPFRLQLQRLFAKALVAIQPSFEHS
jgi:hypothetical protein